MIRLLVINDVHLAASPPMGCRDVYVDDVKGMLVEARQYAIDNGCEFTIFTGDFFHSKRNVPDSLKWWAMDLLQHWPGRKLAIVGNHDLGYGGLASVPSQPIGLLFKEGSLEWLKEDLVVETCLSLTPGAPHNDECSVRIQFSPANYFDAIDHNPQNFGLERVSGVDWAIKVAHGTITVPGKGYPFHVIPMDTIPTEGMDICLFGHPHWDVGIHDVRGCTFASLGSLGRTQHTDDNEQRVMRLLQVQLDKTEVYFDELLLSSAVPADQLFLTKAGSHVEVTKAMRRFVRSVEEAISVEGGSLAEVLAKVGGGDADARAKLRLGEYLEKAGING
jgi:DNA repair exonuclease SbcCD nuclease subunit